MSQNRTLQTLMQQIRHHKQGLAPELDQKQRQQKYEEFVKTIKFWKDQPGSAGLTTQDLASQIEFLEFTECNIRWQDHLIGNLADLAIVHGRLELLNILKQEGVIALQPIASAALCLTNPLLDMSSRQRYVLEFIDSLSNQEIIENLFKQLNHPYKVLSIKFPTPFVDFCRHAETEVFSLLLNKIPGNCLSEKLTTFLFTTRTSEDGDYTVQECHLDGVVQFGSYTNILTVINKMPLNTIKQISQDDYYLYQKNRRVKDSKTNVKANFKSRITHRFSLTEIQRIELCQYLDYINELNLIFTKHSFIHPINEIYIDKFIKILNSKSYSDIYNDQDLFQQLVALIKEENPYKHKELIDIFNNIYFDKIHTIVKNTDSFYKIKLEILSLTKYLHFSNDVCLLEAGLLHINDSMRASGHLETTHSLQIAYECWANIAKPLELDLTSFSPEKVLQIAMHFVGFNLVFREKAIELALLSEKREGLELAKQSIIDTFQKNPPLTLEQLNSCHIYRKLIISHWINYKSIMQALQNKNLLTEQVKKFITEAEQARELNNFNKVIEFLIQSIFLIWMIIV